jgi:O-antigen ligase
MRSEKSGILLAFDCVLRWITFFTVGLAVLAGPWFFGAWEQWWFWPFVGAIFVGLVATGIRLAVMPAQKLSRATMTCLLLMIPFVIYASIRFFMADVFMDAQRSLMLHVTGFCVAIEVLFGLNANQRRYLFWAIFANLLLLGAYGLVNHAWFESKYVMWAPRYEQYAGRATGSYFCPDHFSGAMEILLCLSIGLFADRLRLGTVKWFAVIAAAIAIAGVVLSKSRGGGMTVVIILGMAMIWSVAQWPKAVRWYLRLITGSLALLLLMAFFHFESGYLERFSSYGNVGKSEGIETAVTALSRTCRGRMYGGALRAWQSAPWLGVGPGMHQHLWPHFAPSPDGNAELGIWPTFPNISFRSYEVHSDWLQLLEEYGVVGFIVFCSVCICVFIVLNYFVIHERKRWTHGGVALDDGFFASVLGALLVVIAMGFHSLGDFNLQMPATTWMVAAIVAISLSGINHERAQGSQR